MERLQIAFLGPANSGKSTLVNALAGQRVSLVSEVAGTTTDPVRKAIELPGLGPCVLVDTAGWDDGSVLGTDRRRLTRSVLEGTDLAVVLLPKEAPAATGGGEDHFAEWTGILARERIPYVVVSTWDGSPAEGVLHVDPSTGVGLDSLLGRLSELRPEEKARYLTGGLVGEGSVVVMVMPQDGEAPKGRIILPQAQVLRELLDRGCVPVCCTPASLGAALSGLGRDPDLVVTDSQVFADVQKAIPRGTPLTSFSILLAADKGDIGVFVQGARAIAGLRPGCRVLVAEACSHVPAGEDIGRVKIPALLERRIGGGVAVDVAAGRDFPEDLSGYDLVVHCGGCVASRTLVRSRMEKALRAGVPITNYGVAIAYLQGILDRVSLP